MLLPVVAAVAMLASPAARAQFFSSVGDNLSFPTNFFPFVDAPLLDFRGSTVSIGNSGSGTFIATNVGTTGAVLLADKLTIANSGTGVGGVTVTGPGTQVILTGSTTSTSNRLEVGNWGIGSLSVTGGAIVDASQNAAGCSAPGVFCNSFIGNAAGSSGVLNISGTGSTVSTIGFTGIGSTAVFTQIPDGFNFGTPGGTTNGAVNIDAGGRLNTQSASVGNGPTTASTTGTELGIGSVVIDGAGSQWLATRNTTITNGNASVAIGSRVGGQGTLIVRNEGQLMVDGTGGPNTNFDNLSIGTNGGRGDATVTGTGSNITVRGNNPNIFVGGGGGGGGQGTFNAQAGASVNALFFNVGNGGTGTAVLDGAGTTVTLSGVGTPGLANANAAGFLTIGRNAGSGQATVSNGAKVLINDGGLDSRGSGSPGLQVARDTGSTGSLIITGAGSEIRIASTSLGVATNDNFNPFVAIGRLDAGTNGTLTVSAGGKLILEGNAVSTATAFRTTYMGIGGASDTLVGGTGTTIVTGANSEIRLTGSDAFLTVGRGPGGNGSLTVSNGGSVSSTLLAVGRAGTGSLLVDNGTINLNGQFTSDTTTGAVLNFGQRGGTGTGIITNGSVVNITNMGTNGASVNLGGTGPNPLGTGTLTLSNGSQINVTAAAGLAALSVGRDGTGTANIIGGSTVNIGDGTVHVGRLAGGVGTLDVNGGSKVLAGFIGIGGSSDSVVGGSGTALVSGLGSELRASGSEGFVGVGTSGSGSLTVSDQAQVNGTVMSVGRNATGSGNLTANNATINLTGQQSSGPLSGAGLFVGTAGGLGSVAITNSTNVNITNMGSLGASLEIHQGSMTAGNSSVNITAATGLATAVIGRNGTGTATLTASTLNLSDGTTASGSVIIAGLPGSVGTMVLNAGSVINASYVGVGSTRNPAFNAITNPVQIPGGVGRLVLNDSEVNTDVFELGALGVLSGNNGVVNVAGDVIIGGTIDPGNSAGRIRINSNLISLPGSRLILEIQSDGSGGFLTDTLVIDSLSPFDLSNFDIVFSFLGDTNVQDFATGGGFDFDTFLRTGVGTDESQGLSNRFAAGTTWADIFDPTEITIVSSVFDVSGLSIDGNGSVTVTASRIPEPATWLMMLIGLLAMRLIARRRRGTFAVAH